MSELNQPEKKAGSRRDKIKNIAIVFLAVMLVLTLFSNTFMNYSLPEVSTRYVEPGTINSRVRVNGTVATSDPYVVTVVEGRVVESVPVRTGTEVKKGDVILYLKAGESDELATAQAELDSLIASYEKGILNGDLTAAAVSTSFEENKAKLTALKTRVDAAKDNVEACEKVIESIEKQQELLQNSNQNTTAEKAAVEKAQTAYDSAAMEAHNAQIAYDNAETAYNTASASYEQAKENLTQANAAVDRTTAEAETAKTAAGEAAAAVTAAEEALAENEENVESLRTAKTEAETAKTAADAAVTSAQTALAEAQEALANASENASEDELTTLNAAVTAAQDALTAAEETAGEKASALEEAVTALESVEAAIEAAPETIAALTTAAEAAEAAAEAAKTAKSEAAAAQAEAQAAYDSANTAMTEKSKFLNDNNARLAAAQTGLNTAQAALDAAQAALEKKQSGSATEGTANELARKMIEARDALSTAQENASKLSEEYSELLSQIMTALDQKDQLDAINKQRELVASLTEKAAATEVTAPISGTIISINVRSGEKTVSEAFVIQPSGNECTLTATVTIEQAKLIGMGDVAEIQNAWYYSDVTAVVTGIRTDPSNPQKSRLVTFRVEGSVVDGQNLNLIVGQKSSDYSLTVPNSAVREDADGKFILEIVAKSSPLGTRYTAERIAVEVLASDDTRTAIMGDISSYAYILTTSTRPVEPGQLVRLAD